MIAIDKASILRCLRPVFSLNKFTNTRFYWLLLSSCVPLAIGSVNLVSIAAPLPNSQVVVKGAISRPNLKVGSKGEFVSELQAALKLLGFYQGEVNGVYRQSTANAVFSFQQAAGLSPNGIVDANTWQTLLPSPSTEQIAGSNSNSVNNFPAPVQTGNTTQVANNTTINRVTTEPIPTIPTNRPESKPVKPPKRSNVTKNKPVKKSPPRRQSAASRPRKKPRPSQTTSSPKKPSIQYTAQGLPILRLGMRGSEVWKLQKQLQKLGFLKTSIDGDFGPLTETAVKALQKRYGLEADGVVGGGTWQVINKQIRR